jgi:hypothetical protein
MKLLKRQSIILLIIMWHYMRVPIRQYQCIYPNYQETLSNYYMRAKV